MVVAVAGLLHLLRLRGCWFCALVVLLAFVPWLTEKMEDETAIAKFSDQHKAEPAKDVEEKGENTRFDYGVGAEAKSGER